jgi:hypothetical protein
MHKAAARSSVRKPAPITTLQRMRLRGSLLACVCVVTVLAGIGPAWAALGIVVSEAWTRATPPGVTVGAGYLVIDNGAAREDELLEVSTPAAARIEIHTSFMQDGMMRMRRLSGVRLPARGTLRFEPGGLHLMLIDLRAPLEAGAMVPVTLKFRRAGAVRARLEVRALGN